MLSIEQQLTQDVRQAVSALYGLNAEEKQIQIQKTKKEFEGHLTLVTFPFVKAARKAPEAVGEEIGQWLAGNSGIVASFNVVKGFLNLVIADQVWTRMLNDINAEQHFGIKTAEADAPLMMIEYSSPNTNKPLHLGHVRNNLLGYSLAEIQKANGWRVVKTNIVNDRGIHICKSMLAWLKFGNGETPQSTGKKGDHLIGDYYVRFDQEYKKQIHELMEQGQTEEDAKRNAPIMKEAQQMLLKWEQGDKDVRGLWETMNSWVYAGFDETYKALGVDFDKIYYESQTYLVGKKEVEEGLKKGIFYRRDDGSVWADLRADGLDEKLLLRQDGTSVYMTQDIGTAKLRYADYPIKRMVYVVGNEQDYHFKVLSLLLDKLGFEWGKSLVHFSYGMVELPSGKMKSREGTVVDADDLIQAMIDNAAAITGEKMKDFSDSERAEVNRMVGLGALKYFILKVDPRKNMLFNPEESIDFNGNTGSFLQYAHARICSVLHKAEEQQIDYSHIADSIKLSDKEMELIQRLAEFPAAVMQAGQDFSPAVIANYIYDLVKLYNQFYHDHSILGETDSDIRALRLMLSANVAKVLRTGLSLLGIESPERM